MGSKSKTSTLLSPSTISKTRRNFSRNGTSNQYIVGSVGKSCGKHISNKNSHEQQQRHQNVAIATQVINPSAIGGPLKNRRFVEHFGPPDDDQISFLSNRRRAACGKVFCYGISIAVTVVMMTGLVLAVGYLQSEKHRIETRPVKLAQGQLLEKGDWNLETTSTTPDSTSDSFPATTTTTESSSIFDSKNIEEDDIDEIGLDDYFVGDEDLQKLDNLENDENNLIDSEIPSDTTNEINYKEDSTKEIENIQNSDESKSKDEHHSEEHDNYTNNNDEKQFSEVKVLPPADFAFDGISFEFPIYRSSKNKTNALSTIDRDTITTSSGSAAQNHEKTKELETSINYVNSNFTSFIDSTENNNNKPEEEGILSTPLQEEVKELKNYANAHSPSKENLLNNNKESDSLSSSSHSESSDNYITETTQEIWNKSKDKKISSSFSSTSKSTPLISEYYENMIYNKKNEVVDFDTAPIGSLQTDIFDNNENNDDDFETSASEENVLNANKKINDKEEEEPPRPKPQDNSYTNPRNGGNSRRGQKQKTSTSDYFEEDRPRSDPRKLSLRPKSYRKLKLKGNDYERVIQKEEDRPQQTNNQNQFETTSPPNSNSKTLTVPILEYTADFSKLVTPTPSPSTPETEKVVENFQFQQKHANNVYPDFKFDYTTTSSTPAPTINFNPDEKFDLKEFIRKNDEAHQLKLDFPSVSSSSEQFNSGTIDNVATTFGTPIAAGSQGSLDFASNQHQADNQISKRTFYNYDYDPSASGTSSFTNTNTNTNSNPFAHLLGPQPTSGSFGSPTSTGATLNLFQSQGHQPSSNFNFDTSSSSSGNNFNFPSGTVPVDLSASHIQVNNPLNSYGIQAASQTKPFFTVDANGAFSLTNPSHLPYPNIGPPTNLGNNQGNAFTFSNQNQELSAGSYGAFSNGNSNSRAQILTTGGGQVPTYNTITQGIHLLSLLAPNNGQGFSNDNNNNDQYSSASSIYQAQENEISSKPEYQIAALTGYGGQPTTSQFFKGLGNNFANTYASPPPTNLNYAQDLFPRKSFQRSFDNGDQDSSASFSKTIVSKVSGLDKGLKAIGSSTPPPENSRPVAEATTQPSIFRSLLSSIKKTPETNKNSEPKSYSFSILPKDHGFPSNTLFKKFNEKSNDDDAQAADFESLTPKSRKRFMSKNHDHDMDVASSEISKVILPTPPENNVKASTTLRNFSNVTSKRPKQGGRKTDEQFDDKTKERGGLRSGFFTA